MGEVSVAAAVAAGGVLGEREGVDDSGGGQTIGDREMDGGLRGDDRGLVKKPTFRGTRIYRSPGRSVPVSSSIRAMVSKHPSWRMAGGSRPGPFSKILHVFLFATIRLNSIAANFVTFPLLLFQFGYQIHD